jgi:hypothetical protein
MHLLLMHLHGFVRRCRSWRQAWLCVVAHCGEEEGLLPTFLNGAFHRARSCVTEVRGLSRCAHAAASVPSVHGAAACPSHRCRVRCFFSRRATPRGRSAQQPRKRTCCSCSMQLAEPAGAGDV